MRIGGVGGYCVVYGVVCRSRGAARENVVAGRGKQIDRVLTVN